MYIDYKHAILLAINMLKYGVGMPWDWDPFHTISDLTSIKAFVLVILFVIVPFISVKVHVPLTTHVAPASITTNTSNVVLRRIKELSAPLAVTLMAAAVVLPQALFWYAYPTSILIPSCLCVLNRFANWLHAVLVTIPVLDVVLSATAVRWQGAFGTEPDHNEASEGETQGVEMRLGDAMEDLEAGGVTI